MFEEVRELKVKGTQVAYAMICKRKLWLFSKGVSFEHTSDRVSLGKLLDDTSFNDKEGFTDENVSIDFITSEDGVVVHEVKLSKSMEDAHIFQVKYYLYYLKNKGVKVSHGVIHYPKMRKLRRVDLLEKDAEKLEELLWEIQRTLSLPKPPEVIKAPYCRRCAYYEFCYG